MYSFKEKGVMCVKGWGGESILKTISKYRSDILTISSQYFDFSH